MFFVRLISSLPLSVLYVFSDVLFVLTYYVIRYRRKIVWQNLRNSFPDKPAEELAHIQRSFYRNLCDYAMEMLRLVSMPAEELTRRMQFRNLEVMERFKAAQQPVIVLASHQFNWEWLLVAASLQHPMPADFVYQKVKNKFFNDLSLRVRSRFGAYPIRRDQVARELAKRREIVRMVATVADQYPGYGRDKKYVARFLNQETAFFLGTNQMAILSQYPVVYYRCVRIRRGYYTAEPIVVAEPPYDRESTVPLDNYIRLVEETICKYPDGWLWSHNRWKKRHLSEGQVVRSTTLK